MSGHKPRRTMLVYAILVGCLALTTHVAAQGMVASSDAFPVLGAEYLSQKPTTYTRTIQTEIVSMSLTARGQTLSPTTLPPGSYFVDSFFDVFTELSVDGGQLTPLPVQGNARLRISVGGPGGASGMWDAEIVSMTLSGDAGGMPIIIRESPLLPSPGVHQVETVAEGQYRVDSFFDVFTELSVDGGQTWTASDGPTHLTVLPGQIVKMDSFPVVEAPYVAQNPTRYPKVIQAEIVSMALTATDAANALSVTTLGDGQWYVDSFFDVFTELSLPDKPPAPRAFSGPGVLRIVVAGTASLTTGTFCTEMVQLDLSSHLSLEPILIRESPTIQSAGVHSLTQLGGGLYHIDSFFDVFTELSVDGGQTWMQADTPTRLVIAPLDLQPQAAFEQLDWVGPFDPVLNSAWGRVQTPYDKPAGIYYYNLAVDTGAGLKWVIMNRTIETPGGPQMLSTYFDLGVQPGRDVPSLAFVASLDASPLPLSSGGPEGTVQAAPVEDLSFQLGIDGAPPGPAGAPGPDPNPAGDKKITKSGVLPDLGKFVNQPQKPNQCAPGAISNSLKYLQATGKIASTLPTSISDVGAVIGTTKSGTPASWPTKKKEYYKNHVTTRFIEAPLDASEIQDLINQLKDGQDIEMDLEGHVEVLVGLRWKADGTVDFDLFDDNQTDNESDPTHTSPLMTDGTNDYVDGMKLERFVVECPVERTVACASSFSLNTLEDWMIALQGHECGHVIPMLAHEWDMYWGLWQQPQLIEDPAMPYPETQFVRPELYVYEGDKDPDGESPDDAGLVMTWGNPDVTPGQRGPDQASAWKFKYGADPDLSNCIITVVVTAPQFGAGGGSGQVNQVSLGLETPPAGAGQIRSWYWNCGPVGSGAPIEWGVPTTIKIDTSLTGIAAATPTATNYLNAPGFDITNVQWIIVDENGTWVGGPTPAPGPGGAPVFMWNYWHWLMVSPKTTLSKGYHTKWSQGPVVINEADPPLFWGWDELSNYYQGPIAADDWVCKDNRPITDLHWWGSFPGWKEPYPPCRPKAFHIGIWTDVPAKADDPESYSHPGKLIWSHICDNYVWNFAGYDRDPRQFPPHADPGGGIPGDDPTFEPTDACFQYNQLLSQEDWFYQNTEGQRERVYWISIAPIWDQFCNYQWGWKTRPHFFQDNAVSIHSVLSTSADGTLAPTWPPVLGSVWGAGLPLQIPPYPPHADAVSWDLAFELSTNEPAYEPEPIPGDINRDGVVNLTDMAIVAENYLRIAP